MNYLCLIFIILLHYFRSPEILGNVHYVAIASPKCVNYSTKRGYHCQVSYFVNSNIKTLVFHQESSITRIKYIITFAFCMALYRFQIQITDYKIPRYYCLSFCSYLHGFRRHTTKKTNLQMLRKRGIKTKLRNNIKAIYELTRNYVRKDKEPSVEFVTKEGLHQEAALSPIFFIMIMDDVAKEIKSKIKQIHVGYKCLEAVSVGNVCLWMI